MLVQLNTLAFVLCMVAIRLTRDMVWLWHLANMPMWSAAVRSWRKSGDGRRFYEYTP
jgi:hypothetical protein